MLIKKEFGAFYYIARQGSAVHLSNGGNCVFSIRQNKAVISFSLMEQILSTIKLYSSKSLNEVFAVLLDGLKNNTMEDVELTNISHPNNTAE